MDLMAIMRTINGGRGGGGGGTLQTKTATPTKQTQTVTPDEGYDGLSRVTVDPIPEEYVIPKGSAQITANGSYDVTDKATAVVDVPGPAALLTDYTKDPGTPPTSMTITGLLYARPYALYFQPTLQRLELPDTLHLGASACQEMSAMREILLPEATYLAGSALKFCAELTKVYAPKVELISTQTFMGCSKLEEIILPALTEIAQPTSVFANCQRLKKVRFPRFQALRATTTNIFNNVTSIISVDCGVATTVNGSYSLYGLQNQYNLKLIAARCPTQVAELVTQLNGATPLRQGTGYVLVPRSRIAEYQAATNWATLYSAGTQFLAIEDYTIDSTTTSELDEDKIDALLA